jgi:hypothetical protein
MGSVSRLNALPEYMSSLTFDPEDPSKSRAMYAPDDDIDRPRVRAFAAPAPTGKEDPRRPLLPASIWPRGDRDPPPPIWNVGHE